MSSARSGRASWPERTGLADTHTEDDTPIALTQGAWFADANITLLRPSSISGTVLDERGEPAIGVFVRALAEMRIAGATRFATGPLTTTDDRGMYRLDGLRPGRFVVCVRPVSSSMPADVRTDAISSAASSFLGELSLGAQRLTIFEHYPIAPFGPDGRQLAYPAIFSGDVTSLASAAVIDLKPGRSQSGIDVRLTPRPAVHVSGMLKGSTEEIRGVLIRLVAAGADGLGYGSERPRHCPAPTVRLRS